MSGIGKDSDYPGGEARRKVDHWLREHGVGRDHPIQRAAHAIEHTGRGIYSALHGDKGRAEAEFKRAASNFGDVSRYGH
jgi:hypothetical protein